jgi:isopentenyldiphosphate isomerase
MQADAQDQTELFDVLPVPEQTGSLVTDPSLIKALMAANRDGKLFPTLTRLQAHQSGAWHRSVGLWLFTDDRQVVIQKRSLQKDTNPGKWQMSVAGHVTSGMNVTETVLNEAKEELGIELDPSAVQFVGVTTREERGVTERFGEYWDCEYKFLFVSKISSRKNFTFNPLEVSEVAFRDMTEVFSRFRMKDPSFTPMSERYIALAEAAILRALRR